MGLHSYIYLNVPFFLTFYFLSLFLLAAVCCFWWAAGFVGVRLGTVQRENDDMQRRLAYMTQLWKIHHDALGQLALTLEQPLPCCVSGRCEEFSQPNGVIRMVLDKFSEHTASAVHTDQGRDHMHAGNSHQTPSIQDPNRVTVNVGPDRDLCNCTVVIRPVDDAKRHWVVWQHPDIDVDEISVATLRLAELTEPFCLVYVVCMGDDGQIIVSGVV